jgi:methylmalonyl-CoA mutase
VYEKIKAKALSTVRGTVQADILKEDQAQNTCIFSTEFALKLMGDVQEYFIDHSIQNFYSVSISGYHIAEAGANPISQLAFTLANGFTYIEYYLSRGMNIDDFAPNLSFFFSNGMDPEYSVIGRVARRIWAKAMKHKYNANSHRKLISMISVPHYRLCMPFTTTAILYIPMRMMKPSPRQRRRVFAGRWPYS